MPESCRLRRVYGQGPQVRGTNLHIFAHNLKQCDGATEQDANTTINTGCVVQDSAGELSVDISYEIW